jgi:hypothetical protein
MDIGVWFRGFQVVVTKIWGKQFDMINKDAVFPFSEVEVIDNPYLTIFQNEKKKLLDKIQFLMDKDPDNNEIKEGLNNPNIIEDSKWKIYQKALSLKCSN